jgi:hypothetical protein
MKKNNILKTTITVIVFFAGCFMTGCTNDELLTDSILSKSKSEYENILKKEIDGLIAQSGRLEESFFFLHGMPVWESSKWVNVDSKDMLVVPLLSNNNHNKKHIIGVVENGKISAVITELSDTNISKNRIFSLNNQVLYDGELSTLSPRLKKDDNESAGDLLLLNGGSVEMLFTAANSADITYDSQATAGTLSINAMSSGSSNDSSGDVGHAWITFTDNSGNITTLGTWGNQGSVEYRVNIERDNGYVGVSYSIQITYDQFQNILNYNATPGNQNWTYIYNCAGYATGIWNAVTGTIIGGGLLMAPSDIRNWINNH